MTSYTSIDIMHEGYESWFFFSLFFFGKFLRQGGRSFVSRPVVSIVMKRRRFISVKIGKTKGPWHASSIQGRQQIIIDIADVVLRASQVPTSPRDFAVLINQHHVLTCCETHHGRTYGHRWSLYKILQSCSGICVFMNDVRRCKLTVNVIYVFTRKTATARFGGCDTSKSHDINNRLWSKHVFVECAIFNLPFRSSVSSKTLSHPQSISKFSLRKQLINVDCLHTY